MKGIMMAQTTPAGLTGFEERNGGRAIEWNVHFDLKPTSLSIQYNVTNTRSHPIYLFNVLWELDPKGKYKLADPSGYICLSPSGELHVAELILPLPRDRTVYLRNVPFVTKVEPKQTFTGKVQLPLPVSEYNPYFPVGPNSKFANVMAHSAAFTLQFINDMPEMEAQPAPLPNALRLSHPKLLALVETLRSRPEALSVSVQKREDHFEGF